MILCLPCERIMAIRKKQEQDFWLDLCPECRAKIRRVLKISLTG